MTCISLDSSFSVRSIGRVVLSLRLRAPNTVRTITSTTRLHAVRDIEVNDFNKILKDSVKRAEYQLIDVREQYELETARFHEQDEIINLPMSAGATWSKQVQRGELLDPTKPTILICKAGVRSLNAASYLGKSNHLVITIA